MDVGTLFARLKLDRREFDSELSAAEGNAERTGGAISKALGAAKTALGGALIGGIAAVGGGLIAAGAAGLNFNNSMEQVRAKIGAFTKDAAKTEEILAMVQQRAASTPFAFNDMAEAATALIPSAKQSGIALEELIAQAEILGASNPEEGLAGAAYALKEAVSGDFTSIIERFNLPRQYINELKEQGVPALDAVKMAMQQLGLDGTLVTNMAGTLEGRWSTFLDTLTNVAARVTQPIFDTLSGGLGVLNGLLDANAPKLEAAANLLSGKLSEGIAYVGNIWQQVNPLISNAMSMMNGSLDTSAGVWKSFEQTARGALDGLMAVVDAVLPIIAAFWAENGTQITTTVNTTFKRIGDIVKLAMALLNATIIPALKAIAAFISAHGTEITQLLSNAWNAISAVINIALAVIQGVLKTALALIKGDWSGAWDAMREMVSAVWDNIKVLIDAAISNIKTVMALGWDAIKGAVGPAWEGIKGAITGAFSGVSGAINGTIDGIKGMLSGAWESIKGGARTAWEGIAGVIGSAFGGVIGGIKGVLNGIIDQVNKAIKAFNSLPGPDVSEIPHLATGTDYFQGGMAMVGERGPELVFLPRGSQVIPNNQTERMLASGANTTNNYYLTANYAHQSERRLRDDVMMLQLMGA